MSSAQGKAQPARRHRFSKEILKAVRSHSRLDNWHGPLEIAEHWLVIGFWIWISLYAWRVLHPAVALLVFLPAVFFIGGRQRALAGVLHQACHGTLMSNKTLGRLLGTLLGGYPVLQSYTGYWASHLRDHHGRLGDPRRDPDYQQYQRYGLCGHNLERGALRRHLRSIAGPRTTLSYISHLLRYRIWNPEERRRESLIRLLFFAAAIVLAVFGGWLDILAAYWLLPLITTQVWIGMLAELMEHYPLVESANPRLDLYMSWNRDSNWFERFILGEKKGEGFHLVHHLFPYVPLWRLEEVDRVLARDPVYASLPRLEGALQALGSISQALPARRQS
ncbi:MAG TPA: fatty acid desaturase [Acidobacteriota bacterium]|nr:fatty acid desaturase [Acidobacteriota bacterium]